MTVYVVQNIMTYDRDKNELVPKFDFTPAKIYGEIKFLISPVLKPHCWDIALKDLHNKLQYLTEDDHILLVGNPIFIGLTTMVASEYCSKLRFLQWSGEQRKYLENVVDLELPFV